MSKNFISNIGFLAIIVPLTFVGAETLNFILTQSSIITDVINYSALEIPIPKERSIAEFSFDAETCQKDTPVGDKEEQKNVCLFLFTTVSAIVLTTMYF